MTKSIWHNRFHNRKEHAGFEALNRSIDIDARLFHEEIAATRAHAQALQITQRTQLRIPRVRIVPPRWGRAYFPGRPTVGPPRGDTYGFASCNSPISAKGLVLPPLTTGGTPAFPRMG